jgi:sugar lactone lactonase YvrE
MDCKPRNAGEKTSRASKQQRSLPGIWRSCCYIRHHAGGEICRLFSAASPTSDSRPKKVSMRKVTLRALILALTLALACPAFLHAQVHVYSPDLVTINSAQVNLSTRTIAISGNNFGNQLPEVSLDATSLVVTAFGPAKIQANLPVGLVPGSYRLVVTAGGGPPRFGSMDVTVGAVGLQGPQGLQGPPGMQGRVGPQGPPGVAGPAASAGPSGLAINPSQVALLKWAPYSGLTFAVGSKPDGIAFDGANVWVANGGSDTVTKLRSSDGVNLGTFAVGATPFGIAFDGANLWVANGSGVTKLRASDGSNLGTFGVGASPLGVACDGSNTWVASFGSGTVTKLRSSDGTPLGTFTLPYPPFGLAFDGENIWVTNGQSVTKLRASDGTSLGNFNVGGNSSGVAFDGANIWVVSTGVANSYVTKLRGSDGIVLSAFPVNASGGIAFDGANIWVPGGTGVTRLRARDGLNLGTFSDPGSPYAVAFDGANIWVTNENNGTVSKF